MAEELERLIARDVALCETMTDELEEYLRSRELFWEPNRHRPGGMDLPKLTVGGFLLALRRLDTLRVRLDHDQAVIYSQAQAALAWQKKEWGVRYQDKLTRDLRSRLDAWAWYLEDCEKQGEAAIVHYPRQVETRVKIDLLLDEAHEVALDVDEFRQRQVTLDERLGAFFTVGEFCWLEELAPGFPPDRFWYLWGYPRSD
jgi:hypothetical protein